MQLPIKTQLPFDLEDQPAANQLGSPQMAELFMAQISAEQPNLTLEEKVIRYKDAIEELQERMLRAANHNHHHLINDEDLQVNLNAPLVILTYGLIVIVSLVGNLLVCKVAFSGRRCGRNRRQRTTTDLLIGSLALSDLIMTVFNIPINIMRILMPHWPFGSFLCYFFPFVQTACVYVSTFTMTAIALHRWRTVSPNALANRLVHYSNRLLIGFVWVLAAILALPTVAFNTLKAARVNGQEVIRCRVHYPVLPLGIPSMSLILTVEIFLTQYVIPLFITCVLYAKIARVVTKQGRLVAAAADDDKRRRRHLEAKRRRIIMLITVVVCFAICWLPLSLYHLIIDFGLANHKLSVFLVCHWFAMSSVCYNSLIYCWLNASFRQSAKQTLEDIFRCLKYHQSKNGGGGGGGGLDANGNQLVGGSGRGGDNGDGNGNGNGGTTGVAGATTTRIGGGGGYTNATMAPPSQLHLGIPGQGGGMYAAETTTIIGQMMEEASTAAMMTNAVAPNTDQTPAIIVPSGTGKQPSSTTATTVIVVSSNSSTTPITTTNCLHSGVNPNYKSEEVLVRKLSSSTSHQPQPRTSATGQNTTTANIDIVVQQQEGDQSFVTTVLDNSRSNSSNNNLDSEQLMMGSAVESQLNGSSRTTTTANSNSVQPSSKKKKKKYLAIKRVSTEDESDDEDVDEELFEFSERF